MGILGFTASATKVLWSFEAGRPVPSKFPSTSDTLYTKDCYRGLCNFRLFKSVESKGHSFSILFTRPSLWVDSDWKRQIRSQHWRPLLWLERSRRDAKGLLGYQLQFIKTTQWDSRELIRIRLYSAMYFGIVLRVFLPLWGRDQM